jgi:hypothetical protein
MHLTLKYLATNTDLDGELKNQEPYSLAQKILKYLATKIENLQGQTTQAKGVLT